MNTNCICSTGGIIPQDEVTRTVILTDGTSSVNQSYTPSDNIIIDIDGERRFVVEATILDSGLADFMVSGNPNDLQNRDSAILTVLDDDGELLRSICLQCVNFFLPT